MARTETILQILKGLGVAILTTLLGMTVLAALVVFAPISDALLTVLNQLLKVTAIFLGTLFAVGRGGERGFALGALLGLVYMALGYLIYSIIDAMLAPASQMALEFFLGALIGGISGMVTVNLPARKHTRSRRKRRLA